MTNQKSTNDLARNDPLGLFVRNHRKALGLKRGPEFNAGEHAWLASRGAGNSVRKFREELRNSNS